MKDHDSNDPSLEPVTYSPGATTIWNNSWRRIYEHFAQAIIAYARRRGLNDHSAEDVLQEVMTSLIRCQHGQEPGRDRTRGSFQAWLWGVIKNRVASARRKDQKEQILPPMAEPDAGTEKRSQPLPEIPQPPADFAQLEEDEWQRALLAAALKKVQERVKPQNFAIYVALLEQTASPAALALRYGMETTNSIYQTKARCEEMLLCEARTIREAWEQLRQTPNL